MYKDTEQAYKGWTLDVYQNTDGMWVVDGWVSGIAKSGFSLTGKKRKEVICSAKVIVDSSLLSTK